MENLQQNQCINLLDFTENYSFIAQDDVKGFHWNNSQAMLHPFVFYYKNLENDLNCTNYCVVSNSMFWNVLTLSY